MLGVTASSETGSLVHRPLSRAGRPRFGAAASVEVSWLADAPLSGRATVFGVAAWPEVGWLAECSVTALGEALRVVAPELSEYPITVPEPGAGVDPVFWGGSTVVDGRFLVKFAWSRPAACLLAREIGALTSLGPVVPFLPEVVASGSDPLLLVTRMVPGRSLFRVVDSIDREWAGRQLARFLAVLHGPTTYERAVAAVGELSGPLLPPATTTTLRDRLGQWVRPEQRQAVWCWCDWTDAVLAAPAPETVLVHGDLHGDNQVWDHDELRLVVDFQTVGIAEPEYDLRAFPGPGMGPGVELLDAVMRHYQQITGRRVSADRVMAWHVRQTLGDVLWRSEAGLPMADDRTPAQWVDDLSARFMAMGIDSQRLVRGE